MPYLSLGYRPRERSESHFPKPYESARRQDHTCFGRYRLYLHLVWPTKYRKHLLGEKLTPVVESKILEVCQTRQYQLFVVKAAVDHMHVLLGMRPTQAVSDVVRNLKTNSSAAAFATFSRLSEII